MVCSFLFSICKSGFYVMSFNMVVFNQLLINSYCPFAVGLTMLVTFICENNPKGVSILKVKFYIVDLRSSWKWFPATNVFSIILLIKLKLNTWQFHLKSSKNIEFVTHHLRISRLFYQWFTLVWVDKMRNFSMIKVGLLDL